MVQGTKADLPAGVERRCFLLGQALGNGYIYRFNIDKHMQLLCMAWNMRRTGESGKCKRTVAVEVGQNQRPVGIALTPTPPCTCPPQKLVFE